jgi:hypothetical protein
MELISRIHTRDKLILIAGGLEYLADDLLDFYKNDIPKHRADRFRRSAIHMLLIALNTIKRKQR